MLLGELKLAKYVSSASQILFSRIVKKRISPFGLFSMIFAYSVVYLYGYYHGEHGGHGERTGKRIFAG
jgi:hypothetical protein